MRSEEMPMRLICCNKEDFVRWRGTQEFFWGLLLASNQVAQVWFFPTAGWCTFFFRSRGRGVWSVDTFQLPSSKSASQIGHSLTLISVHKKFIKRSNSISMCFTLSNAPKGEFGSWIQFFYGFLRNAPQNLILYILVQLHNSCRFIFMFSFFRFSPASSGRPRSRSSLITSMVLGLAFPKRARDDNVWNKT